MGKKPPESQPIGNTDDRKRGRDLTKTRREGPRGQNPVTLDQVRGRRGLAAQDEQG